jgi:hypothetical protein
VPEAARLLAETIWAAFRFGGQGEKEVMSKTQWEYDLVERPFCEQLKAMGWQWIEGAKGLLAGWNLTRRGEQHVFQSTI